MTNDSNQLAKTMNHNEDYRIENVWQNIPPAVEGEIIRFWQENNALPNREQAQARIKQVIFVARNSDGKIVGISTAYKKFNEGLEHNFYYMRAFIHPDYRQSGIARSFALGIIEFFEKRFVDKIETDAIGIFLETENQAIRNNRREAVMEKTGFVYIGKNSKGDHLRVRYFKGATI